MSSADLGELDAVEPAAIIAEAIHELGVDAPSSKLLQAARGVWRGIGSEWEFAALAVWGGARLVQRIDSGQWTSEATSRYKTPDLLVVVPDSEGRDVACWVEVKTSHKEKIAVSEREFGRMKAFQATTGLPCLMAYKHQTHIWSLREVDTLHKVRTAYRLDLSDMYDNLMGTLLNDFAFVVQEGTGLYIVLEREDGQLADQPGRAKFTVGGRVLRQCRRNQAGRASLDAIRPDGPRPCGELRIPPARRSLTPSQAQIARRWLSAIIFSECGGGFTTNRLETCLGALSFVRPRKQTRPRRWRMNCLPGASRPTSSISSLRVSPRPSRTSHDAINPASKEPCLGGRPAPMSAWGRSVKTPWHP